MCNINFDINKDIEAWDGGGIDGDEATVSVVDEKVGAESGGGEVVDATGAVGEVTENVTVSNGGEGGEDVGECKRVH